ncbi:Eco57I restriction-modification methylase domain-containing protein [Mycoplasma sp. CSL10166]|uniref:Eco57I restriction-modification methylase domain-containing protein n=1 Tax=Mycoplasma sp. CSL10166 TaxID=2813825 RepID=UPI00197C6990|nr:hypothetical protein [Mycoplasma sp. CSL10166]MBN4084427.1 hypothetical protein [Mycoplasma sp. CSL10166]
MIKNKKQIKLGQFFTKRNVWLKPQVLEFINYSKMNIIYDPFAGSGDLFNAFKKGFFKSEVGLDIDKDLKWKYNDSLINIPHIDDAIIITNPPYIKKHSAKRNGIDLKKYFNSTNYDDIYLLALEKMINAQKFVVAIVPESFINSNFKDKNKLYSITILEENPFFDTETPVCVVCFDGIEKPLSKIKIYKNEEYIDNLEKIYSHSLPTLKKINVKFNDKKGWLALKAIDGTKENSKIKFDLKENIEYDWENKIKTSSRHITLINLSIQNSMKKRFINKINNILDNLRKDTNDIILTPFKGNTKKGERRRRLDFKLARGIIEKAYNELHKEFFNE